MNRNVPLATLANESGLSETAINKAEKGDSALKIYLNILLVLDKTDNLLAAFPGEGESPVQLLKSQRKVKQRAREKTSSRPDSDTSSKEELDW